MGTSCECDTAMDTAEGRHVPEGAYCKVSMDNQVHD